MNTPPKIKVLMVNRAQYGYHVDPYKYSVYLKKDFDITHLSWDYGLPHIHQAGIEIKYISRNGNSVQRYFRFLSAVHKEIRNHSYDLIFLVYFMGCSIIRWLHSSRTCIVDIRTATVDDSPLQNRLKDILLVKECKGFEHISIVSENLARKTGLTEAHILPLGGECFSTDNAKKDGLYLLYVGTLENRNMMTFIRGFHQFYLGSLEKNIDRPLHLTIVGDGPGDELKEIMAYIQKNNLQQVIFTEGYVQNDLLHPYFEKSNIGVSYVPITPYFQNQPPTKTYEYLLSGLAVLATSTHENAKVINEKNGVLIQDKTADVVSGLQLLAQRMERYQPEDIRKQMSGYLWEKIAQDNLKPYLIGLAQQREENLTRRRRKHFVKI